jgi:citrate lyase beta subunit
MLGDCRIWQICLTFWQTRLDQSTSRNKVISVENKGKKPQAEHQHTAEQEAPNGFVLPDLNLPADVWYMAEFVGGHNLQIELAR